MAKITPKSIFLFFVVKYFIFFVILAFIGNRYKFIVLDNSKNISDIITLTLSYFLHFFPTSIPISIVLSVLLYSVLTLNKKIFIVPCLLLILSIEYLIYDFLHVDRSHYLGIINSALSVFFLFIFFGKSIFLRFK